MAGHRAAILFNEFNHKVVAQLNEELITHISELFSVVRNIDLRIGKKSAKKSKDKKNEILMNYFLGTGLESVLNFSQVYVSVIQLIFINKAEVDISKFFNYNFESNKSFYYYSIPKFLLDLVSIAAEDKENFLLLLVLMIHCTEKRTNVLFGYLLSLGDKIKGKEEESKLRIINLTHWLFKIFNENEDYEKFKSLLLERDLYIPERDSMYKRLFSDYREREMDLKDPRIQEFLKRNK